MIKYVPQDTSVTFAEIPTEITLCLNLSLCPHHCPECHSQYLQTDIGDELTENIIDELLVRHKGITCILFMGGDGDKERLSQLATYAKSKGVLSGWYSGETELDLSEYGRYFDYIKVGPYIKERGPLNSPTTNQRLYKLTKNSIEDITHIFHKISTFR